VEKAELSVKAKLLKSNICCVIYTIYVGRHSAATSLLFCLSSSSMDTRKQATGLYFHPTYPFYTQTKTKLN